MRWTRAVLTGLLVAATTAAALAAIAYRHDVGGKLLPVAAPGPEKGRYHVAIGTQGRRTREHVSLHAYKLDRTKDENGRMPVFHVWFVNEEGTLEADFGKLPTNRFGHGYFVFDTRRDEFPDGVGSIFDFDEGGRVEVRGEGGPVLRAEIGRFQRRRIGGSSGGGRGGGY